MYVKSKTDILVSQKNAVAEYVKDFENGLINAKKTLNKFSSAWQGNDYLQFARKMNAFMQDLSKFNETLNQYSNFLEGYTNATMELDKYYVENKSINIS